MNTIKIQEQKQETSTLTGGEIFLYNGTLYMVVKTYNISELPHVLVSLFDGNLWSSTSTFGGKEHEFKRFYGVVTITTK